MTNKTAKMKTGALGLCLVLLSGCAVLQDRPNNLLDNLDQNIATSGVVKSTAAKVALAPVGITAGAVALSGDMLVRVWHGAVLHPLKVARPAWDDTYDWLWDKPEGSDLRQTLLLIPKTIGTPVLLLTDWSFRALFTTSPLKGEEQ